MDELDAFLELRLLVPLGGLQRALQVVEDRQQLFHDPLACPRDQALLIARGPLAVVVEVGLQALEGVDQLLVLVPERIELRVLGRQDCSACSLFSTFSGMSDQHMSWNQVPGHGHWGRVSGTRSWD